MLHLLLSVCKAQTTKTSIWILQSLNKFNVKICYYNMKQLCWKLLTYVWVQLSTCNCACVGEIDWVCVCIHVRECVCMWVCEEREKNSQCVIHLNGIKEVLWVKIKQPIKANEKSWSVCDFHTFDQSRKSLVKQNFIVVYEGQLGVWCA